MLSTPTGRTTGQTILLAVGGVVLVAGLVCVVLGFTGFVGSQDDFGGDGAGRSMAVFAAGGLAMVVGLGIVAFTRASAMSRDGGYVRVTVEQGTNPAGGPGEDGQPTTT